MITFSRCGFAGDASPRHIIPTTVTIDGQVFIEYIEFTFIANE